MGIYFNPDNGSFVSDKNSKIYIDKTGLLDFLNDVIGTNGKCIAVSHARRFGKSHAAGMIDAYYSLGSESSALFEDTEIAKKESFRKHLNKYNVIHLDISSFWDSYKENIIDAGLKDDIMTMLSGGKVRVNPNSFRNDLSTISSKDEALTALIHLGYLGYDADRKKAFIPNYEVATAFEAALQIGEWSEIAKAISTCDELLDETIEGNEERVAELIELAHEAYTSVLKYNDENSLSCVLTMAYFTAPAYYNVVREFPSGKGYADFAFIPRANAGNHPAMIVELKYNQSADSAIAQIKERRYQGALSGYSDKILLVGINYDADGKENKKHTCVIEEWMVPDGISARTLEDMDRAISNFKMGEVSPAVDLSDF